MFEKVNRHHPDKIADRIAGAIVDLAYSKSANPKVACEVLVGHGRCLIINETSQHLTYNEVNAIVDRIAGATVIGEYIEVPQDEHLAENQNGMIRCGDNGVFKGTPVTMEEELLSYFSSRMDYFFDSDGKYIIDWKDNEIHIIICQSEPSELGIAHMKEIGVENKSLDCMIEEVATALVMYFSLKERHFPENMSLKMTINPLGDWTGGINVDTGATNRKLGSDMGRAVTGGGIHGKDLSKADVSVNIFAHIMANHTNSSKEYICAIGDETVNGIPYKDIVEIARKYVKDIGGFEKLAEVGLI